jgi:PAS domain S-box-containing protein
MDKSNVLVIEDNAIMRKMMRVALESAGYGVVEAPDGKTAVRLVNKEPPALILQDLLLPDVDCLDLVKELRRSMPENQIPILACTGLMSKLDEARTLQGGFTDYLFKPIEPSRLVQVVERYLAAPALEAKKGKKKTKILLVDDDAIEDEERKLAEKVGADALVSRTPDLKEAVKALRDALKRRSHPKPTYDSETLTENYLQRLVRQLEQQTSRNGDLMRRAAEEKAQLAVVASITETLNRRLPLQAALDEALARILDAAGISMGAIFLVEPDGKLILESQIGYTKSKLDELQDFFGHSALLYRSLKDGQVFKMPSPEIAGNITRNLQEKIHTQSLLIAPLIVADEPQGVLVAFSSRTELGDDWVNSVRTVTGQLAQAVLLARTLARVSESEQRFRELAENIREIFYVAGSDGRPIHYISPVYEQITGRDREDLYRDARAWLANTHPEDRPRVERALESDPQNFDQEYRILRPDGAQRWLRERTFPVKDETGKVVRTVGIAEDTTERRIVETALERRYREIQALHDISQIILSSPDIVTTMERILDKAISIGSYDISVIRLFDPRTLTLQPVAWRGYRDPKNVKRHHLRTIDAMTGMMTAQAMTVKEPHFEEDVPNSAGLRTLKREGVQSAVVIPLLAEEEILGIFQLASRTPRKFTPDDIRLLEAIGNQMGLAIQKARLNEETRQNLDRIRALHEIDVAITSTLDLHTILKVLLEKIEVFLPIAAASTVRLLNRDTGHLESLACRGLDEEEWRSQPQTMPLGRARKVVATQAPVVVANIQKDPGAHTPEIFRRRGLISYLGVPLIAKGEVLGVLSLYTVHEHAFSKEEIEFLSTLAGQAAIAIQNAQLFAKVDSARSELEITNRYLDKSLKQLVGLYTALAPLVPSESIQETMGGMIQRLMDATGADATLIRLWDKRTNNYLIAGHSGFADDYLKRVEITPRDGAVEWVVKHGEPIIAGDIAAEPRLKGKVQLKLGLRSCAMLPLHVHNEVRGLIHLASRRVGYFDAEQQDHLMAISRQMGIALENRELFDNLKASRDDLEKANKVKNEFLSVMSHELRTPLSIVLGYTSLVKDGKLGAINVQQKQALQKVLSRAGDQLEMINEIMQTTQLEAHAMNANYELIDLRDMLDQLRSDHEVRADKKNIKLMWDYPATAMPVVADGAKLRQILHNLINNALKFTEKGTVAVSARIRDRGLGVGNLELATQSSPLSQTPDSQSPIPNSRFIEFRVTDTGIGISKDKFETIFQKFHQVDSSETRLFGGVGLGLYIVKHFTELLGGKVDVESKEGKGSTFTVTVPVRGVTPSGAYRLQG